jgi:hypothetical protein
MAETKDDRKGFASLVPWIVGGLIGGGIAAVFAPQLLRARGTVIAGAAKVRERIRKNRQPKTEGTYCAVPEGADICFDEKEDQ